MWSAVFALAAAAELTADLRTTELTRAERIPAKRQVNDSSATVELTATTVSAASSASSGSLGTTPASVTTATATVGLGGGILGTAAATFGNATPVDEAEAELHAVDEAASDEATSEARPPSPAATSPRYNISGFDGQPLSATSAALDARCQSAVADSMARLADGGQPAQLYADPLRDARVAPLNTTDDVRFVYFIGVGDRPHAHLVVSRLLYALYSPTHLFLLHLDIKVLCPSMPFHALPLSFHALPCTSTELPCPSKRFH